MLAKRAILAATRCPFIELRASEAFVLETPTCWRPISTRMAAARSAITSNRGRFVAARPSYQVLLKYLSPPGNLVNPSRLGPSQAR